MLAPLHLPLLVGLLAPPAPRAEGPAPADRGEPTLRAAQPEDSQAAPQAAIAATLEVDATPPFPSEELELSEVLRRAVDTSVELNLARSDVEISESRILAALGAYDVFLSAGLSGTLQEQPQRGSQFTASTGSRTLGGFVGFNRKLETGGSIDLRIDVSRNQTDQPLNFFSPGSDTVTISSYRVAPTLTLSHPLLKGAGLRVNRADIDRAKIAASSSEAARVLAAQNLVRDIISAYWDVLYAARDLLNKRRSVKVAERQLQRTQIQVQAGRLAPVDLKSVEQSVAARNNEALLAEVALLDASLNLRTLMGQDFDGRDLIGVIPSTDPVVQPRPVDPEAEVQAALAHNPQVRQLELALASRRIDELVAANNRLPQLDVSATFTPQGRSVDTLPSSTTGEAGSRGNWGEAFRNFFSTDIRRDGLLADWTLTGNLTLTWDVQNRPGKGNHGAALGELEKARLNLRQVRQQVATGTLRAAYNLRSAASRMEVAQISLDLALQNLQTEQARFDVGRSTTFDLTQRLDEVDAAAAGALQAQIDYLKALVQLQALTGRILPAYGLDEPSGP